MAALAARRSTRAFSPRQISAQLLSNLLWAAAGVNRDDGRRTAPSARNRQEIDIYVAMAQGVLIYDASAHRLTAVLNDDVREQTGMQDYVGAAPINLVYVADFSRMLGRNDEERLINAWGATGFIAQNVYLYCASERLATIVRGSVDRDALSSTLNLRPSQHITLAQTVGYPAGAE